MITERDYINILETAREDGEAKGRREGFAEAKRAIAKAMLESGMPVNQIATLTGLSEEEIKEL